MQTSFNKSSTPLSTTDKVSESPFDVLSYSQLRHLIFMSCAILLKLQYVTQQGQRESRVQGNCTHACKRDTHACKTWHASVSRWHARVHLLYCHVNIYTHVRTHACLTRVRACHIWHVLRDTRDSRFPLLRHICWSPLGYSTLPWGVKYRGCFTSPLW